MSSEPTANNRRDQYAPTPAVITLDGEIKTFTTSGDAQRYANKNGGEYGQWFSGLNQLIK